MEETTNNVEALEEMAVQEDIFNPEEGVATVNVANGNAIAALVTGLIGVGIVGGLALKRHLKKKKQLKEEAEKGSGSSSDENSECEVVDAEIIEVDK